MRSSGRHHLGLPVDPGDGQPSDVVQAAADAGQGRPDIGVALRHLRGEVAARDLAVLGPGNLAGDVDGLRAGREGHLTMDVDDGKSGRIDGLDRHERSFGSPRVRCTAQHGQTPPKGATEEGPAPPTCRPASRCIGALAQTGEDVVAARALRHDDETGLHQPAGGSRDGPPLVPRRPGSWRRNGSACPARWACRCNWSGHSRRSRLEVALAALLVTSGLHTVSAHRHRATARGVGLAAVQQEPHALRVRTGAGVPAWTAARRPAPGLLRPQGAATAPPRCSCRHGSRRSTSCSSAPVCKVGLDPHLRGRAVLMHSSDRRLNARLLGPDHRRRRP